MSKKKKKRKKGDERNVMRRGPSIHKIYNFPDYDAKNKWEEIICGETPFLEMARLKKTIVINIAI